MMPASAFLSVETLEFLPLGATDALDDSPVAGLLRPDADPLQTGAPPLQLYAILDPQKALFLEDRLQAGRAPFQPLFTHAEDDPLRSVTPFVIGLEPDDRLLRAFFQSPETAGPRGLLGSDAGMLVQTALPLDQLVAALRRFTMLADEHGVRIFFRLQEPGMIAAALSCAPGGAVRDFVERTGIRRLIWTETAMTEGGFLAHVAAPTPAVQDEPAQRLVLGPDERRGLTHQVNRRLARDLAREHAIDPALREDMAQVYNRLLDGGHESPFAMESFWILLRQIPAANHARIWAEVDEHRYGLAMINRMLADHYGLQFRVPEGYEPEGLEGVTL